MLVLTRFKGEEILIGDDIVIHLADATHGKARIGIEAPKHVRILRREVAIREEQNSASQAKN